MDGITDADRKAALQLRVVLADICGFWHPVGDDSPLCLALARHRIEAERRLADKLIPLPTALKTARADRPAETSPPMLAAVRADSSARLLAK